MDRASDYYMRESLIAIENSKRRGRLSPPLKLHNSKEGPAPAKKQLVVCCPQPDRRRGKYIIVFLPIENLLVPSTDDDTFGGGRESQFLEPRYTLIWKFSDMEPYYNGMSFHHSSNKGKEVLYAGGGLDRPPSDISLVLPNELNYIPLSGNNYFPIEHAKVERTTPMKYGKYCPLIVEIGGCIYVLSATPPMSVFMKHDLPFSTDSWCSFEVYIPWEDTWETLPHPPFMEPFVGDNFYGYYNSPLGPYRHYSYLVVDNHKLFVSDGVCSCVFDTVVNEWEACELFSNIFEATPQPDVKQISGLNLPYNCGLGFPFRNQAIPWRDGIFLCIILIQLPPPIAAFKIPNDGVKAVEVPVRFEKICPWYGDCVHLVDLGDDYIVVLLYEKDVHHLLTIVTYKLYLGDDGILTGVRKSVRYCDGRYYGKLALHCFAL